MFQRRVVFSVIILFVFALFYTWIEQAEARRMGGGRSFGSSPSYQRSAPQPSSPQKTQPGQAQPTPQSPAAAPRPFGGMLGGLLMGGLIGSLLFGGMHSWGGPGLLDILLIGGVLFFVYRFIKARRLATQEAGQAAFSTGLGSQENWGASSSAGYGPAQGMPMSAHAEEVKIPKDFDQEDFMKGAKAVYTRLQKSWDKRDLEDIRQFTSKEVWEEIKRQAQEDPQPGKTEILRVNARLLEVASSNSHTVASVLFDVLMRESKERDMAEEVHEIWHFSKEDDDPKSFWVLEGIQQTEE